MKFTKLQLAAIYKLGYMMTIADGFVDKAEEDHLIYTFTKLSVANGYDFAPIGEFAKGMEASDVVPALIGLDKSQALYVVAFMGVLMTIDKHIDDSEMKMYKLTCQICGLPVLSISECLDIWESINNL